MALIALCAATSALHANAQVVALHRNRLHATDLEIGGDLTGIPHGETRFVAYADLLKLPQESATVSDDSNFVGSVRISGVAVAKLPTLLHAANSAHMVIAICDDLYNAHYPAAYLAAHHPILVLRVNGKDPAHWPKGADGSAMGPYMISHPKFTPAFRVLAHDDEAQVPWGVLRIDFRRESDVYAPIQPIGADTTSPQVQQGFAIAKQNCFRCHSRNGEGGLKAHRSWTTIARHADEDPREFDNYVLTPTQVDPSSQMAPSPNYDAVTLAALRAYFRPFADSP